MTADKKSPDCNGVLTPSTQEGPFYTPGSPERNNIVGPGTAGTPLVLEGKVFDRDCRPVAGAWIDFWHADGNGQYDNEGYNLRGHQYTDKNGHFRLETVRPAAYGPRTSHIHVKVRAGENSPVLTTQMFFPGEPKNQSDFIFNSALLVEITGAEKEQKATFNFVMETG